MRSINASERASLIKLASTLPEGSSERKAILASLKSANFMETKITSTSPNHHVLEIYFETKYLFDKGALSADKAFEILREDVKQLKDHLRSHNIDFTGNAIYVRPSGDMLRVGLKLLLLVPFQQLVDQGVLADSGFPVRY